MQNDNNTTKRLVLSRNEQKQNRNRMNTIEMQHNATSNLMPYFFPGHSEEIQLSPDYVSKMHLLACIFFKCWDYFPYAYENCFKFKPYLHFKNHPRHLPPIAAANAVSVNSIESSCD